MQKLKGVLHLAEKELVMSKITIVDKSKDEHGRIYILSPDIRGRLYTAVDSLLCYLELLSNQIEVVIVSPVNTQAPGEVNFIDIKVVTVKPQHDEFKFQIFFKNDEESQNLLYRRFSEELTKYFERKLIQIKEDMKLYNHHRMLASSKLTKYTQKTSTTI